MNSNPEHNEKDYIEQKIKKNNAQITRLLAENEELLRSAGFDPPAKNYALHNNARIKFPSNYIRTKDYFVKKYKLRYFFKDPVTVSNVAYSLQMSDLYNFIVNRFKIFGSINTMVYKAATVNCVSIIESLMGQTLDDMHAYCAKCKHHNECEYFFAKKQQFSDKLDKIMKYDMLRLNDKEYQRIRDAYRLRNHMHIYTAAKENELTSKTFDRDLYNGMISIMQQVTINLYRYMLPAAKRCYKEIREEQD
ncbi:hypothetical protein [Butyrivibrio sp. XPD2006]|uniref:hypothetical protein n=1 Tax=Butyrivibrio sp. XPD2006 TaxID=1280668 RepID=UPI0003B6A554|nr:hypothetical protein [Butyrivibrio sp. XPD2006]